MPRTGAPENMIPLNKRTKEEQKAITTKGGIASGKARKEKKRMSQIYADFLANEFEIEIEEGKREKMTGAGLVNEMMRRVVMRGDAATVSIMKEIREATEGSKVHLDGNVTSLTPEERKARIEELERKRADRTRRD